MYGKKVKIIRIYKAKSQKQLLVEQEDGRKIKISSIETNLEEERQEEVKVNQISVRTLISLAELIENMIASQEGKIHEASIERKSINSSNWQQKPSSTNLNLQTRDSNQPNNTKDPIQKPGVKSSTPVNPMLSTTHSSNTTGRLRTIKGAKQ